MGTWPIEWQTLAVALPMGGSSNLSADSQTKQICYVPACPIRRVGRVKGDEGYR
jgi:hypothetical protein